MERIVIVGASGHGKVVADAVQRSGIGIVVGYLDDDISIAPRIFGLPVLGPVESLPEALSENRGTGVAVAIGNNRTRWRVVRQLKSVMQDVRFITVIHPTASVASGARIGSGTVVCAGAVIGPESEVGDHCILNVQCSLDHDCKMGDFAALAPGTIVGGDVSIGCFSWIGIGVSVLHGIRIGDHTVVGAGGVVVDNLPDHVIAYGVPAKPCVRGLRMSRFCSVALLEAHCLFGTTQRVYARRFPHVELVWVSSWKE